MHQSPTRHRKIGVAVLLALAAGGIALTAWLAVPDRPPAGTAAVVRAARDEAVPAPVGSLREVMAHPEVIPTHHHPLLGRPAPDFALADSAGKVRTLHELRAGSALVLEFFYGHHCKGCVRQLYDLAGNLPRFREAGARVVAVSADPPEQTRHRLRQDGAFGFPVLSDADNRVAHAYQVFRAENLRHGTFLIDRQGTIRWVNVGDAPFRRTRALLYQLLTVADRAAPVEPGP